MQSTVSERIDSMVKHFTKGNKSAFAKAVGISNQSLGEIVGSRQSAPSFAALQKILAAFPEVRIEWLVNGEGPRLKSEADSGPQWAKKEPPTHRPKLPDGGEVYDGYIGNYPVLSPRNGETIPIIAHRDIHKYLQRNSPPVLPKDLPSYEVDPYESIAMPASFLESSKHVAFPMLNNCMEPTLVQNDFVICSYVDKSQWEYVNRNAFCTLLAKSHTILTGRITFDFEKQKVYCRFDNQNWFTITLDISDIYEIWAFKWKLSSSSEDVSERVQSAAVERTAEMIQELQRSLDVLNQKVSNTFRSFREYVKEFIEERLKKREDIDKLNFKDMANTDYIREMYIKEYGPIKSVEKYNSDVISIMRAVSSEISLGFPYAPDDKTEQNEA